MTEQAKNAMTTTQETRLTIQSDDPISGLLWDTAKFEHLQRVATMFSKSGMVPDLFRGNVAACAVGIQLAQQLQVAPFMLFQKMYIVGGKPGIEAQLAIAVANQRGVFTAPIDYEFHGENKDRTRACTAKAVLSKSKTPVSMTVDWNIVQSEGWDKKGGSKWNTMPDQMFRYRSAMWLIRTYCPEVLFGMYSTEELDDMRTIDITPRREPSKAAVDALRDGADITVGEQAEDATVTDHGESGAQEQEKTPISEPQTGLPETQNKETTSGQGEGSEHAPAFEKAKADTMIDELVAKAGYNDEKKMAALDIVFKTATDGKPRETWDEFDYKSIESTLRTIIQKNENLAKHRAHAAEKKE